MVTYRLKEKGKIITIEYLGLPAVGKTTQVNALEKNDAIININNSFGDKFIHRQFRKITNMISFLVTNPITFITDTKIILSSQQETLLDLFKVLFNWYLIAHSYIKVDKRSKDTYVWDQGISQALWSILFTSENPNSQKILKLLKDKQLPDQIIFLDEPNEILRKRAINRESKIRLDYKDEKQVSKARKSLEIVLQILEDNYFREDN